MAMRGWGGRLMAEATELWWVLLITGSLWILLSLAILQFNLTSVWSIAILTGIVLMLAGATEMAIAFLAPRYTWAHVLLGVLFFVGGIIAFAWPGETFQVLARLIGWYLLFLGTFEVVESLLSPRRDLWWLRLVAGAATIGIAFWAVGSTERSVALLILWVGLGALFRGINQILTAFQFREIHEAAVASANEPPPMPPGTLYDARSERPTSTGS